MIAEYKSTAQYNIVAPFGAFANHIRWLLLLDSSFSMSNNYSNLPENINAELNSKFNKINFSQIDSKLTSFRDYIYPSSRTWHNWLIFEWRWRTRLNEYINLCHHYDELTNIHKKTIVCTIDPDIAYKSYVKFNSNCNNTDKDVFLSTVEKANEFHSTLVNNNIVVVDSGILFNEILDREWYLQLINWFELEDHYSIAQQVHKLWYDGHKRAESDIIIALTNLYKNH
jgi:hypothetical protein